MVHIYLDKLNDVVWVLIFPLMDMCDIYAECELLMYAFL